MSSDPLDVLKEPEKEIPDFPVQRFESNCEKWAQETELACAKLGLAEVLQLVSDDREDLARTERVALEKVYGILLHSKGPLRRQPEKRVRQDSGRAAERNGAATSQS